MLGEEAKSLVELVHNLPYQKRPQRVPSHHDWCPATFLIKFQMPGQASGHIVNQPPPIGRVVLVRPLLTSRKLSDKGHSALPLRSEHLEDLGGSVGEGLWRRSARGEEDHMGSVLGHGSVGALGFLAHIATILPSSSLSALESLDGLLDEGLEGLSKKGENSGSVAQSLTHPADELHAHERVAAQILVGGCPGRLDLLLQVLRADGQRGGDQEVHGSLEVLLLKASNCSGLSILGLHARCFASLLDRRDLADELLQVSSTSSLVSNVVLELGSVNIKDVVGDGIEASDLVVVRGLGEGVEVHGSDSGAGQLLVAPPLA
mmetsp:Transcript_15334/g.23873  ORF Transcript_15334/g.23873 Transcript_15334/m.23873 type:complete len:318 (-) Transcript_15334:662-1615(-)